MRPPCSLATRFVARARARPRRSGDAAGRDRHEWRHETFRTRAVPPSFGATNPQKTAADLLSERQGDPRPRRRVLLALSGAPTHDKEGHPECAARAASIESKLVGEGLLLASSAGDGGKGRNETFESGVPGVLDLLDAPLATPSAVLPDVAAAARAGFSFSAAPSSSPLVLPPGVGGLAAALASVHDPSYLEALSESCSKIATKRGAVVIESSPTYATGTTFDDSVRACSAACSLVDAVVLSSPGPSSDSSKTTTTVGFGLTRPPGHHARPASAGAMGFCLLSTAAVAARYAQVAHPEKVKKVAIFDFDVHHGNGTEDVFWKDDTVLYVSTHQDGTFPGTGKVGSVGGGDRGGGFTVNLPLPGSSGDAALIAALEDVVLPALARFDPDLLIVSAGYDAHWRDPLASMNALTRTYHRICSELIDFAEGKGRGGESRPTTPSSSSSSPPSGCNGRVVFLLEGGYDLRGLGDSVADSVRGVLGLPSLDSFDKGMLADEPTDKVKRAIAEARRIHGL